MAMMTLVLHPLDTLFFRDGRPYNQDDPGQVEAMSVFPPYPPTVVGAVRAALARALGWNGGAWGDELKKTLGDGVDWQNGGKPLGAMSFAGPYVLQQGQPLLPAPLCLVERKAENDRVEVERLAPSNQTLGCDLGDEVRLPAASRKGDGWKTLEGRWLDAAGMGRLLNWQNPEPSNIIPAKCIWQREERVGIRRDEKRRTTVDRALYAAAHTRPARDIALAVEIGGLPDVQIEGRLAPLGGEGRSVWVELVKKRIELPRAPKLGVSADGKIRYTVIHITPADLGHEDWPGPGGILEGAGGAALPGQVVSACLGKPVPVGGWDSIGRRPLPLRPLVPAGSVWFMTAETDEAEAAECWHGQAVGAATAWGFGRVLIGRWEPAGEEA